MNQPSSKAKRGLSMSPVQSDQIWLLAILAGVSFVLAMVVVLIVGRFTNVTTSAWGIVGSIAPWYLAAISGWILYTMLPVYVAHGRTRKRAYRVWVFTGAILAPMAAVCMAIGYQLERVVYDLAGFSTSLDENYYFGNRSEIHLILFQYVLTFLVWFVLGGFVGAALYRFTDLGWVSIPVAIGIASLTGVWNHSGGGFFGILRRIVPSINHESLWLDLGLSTAAIAVVLYLAWTIVHDLPLRNPG